MAVTFAITHQKLPLVLSNIKRINPKTTAKSHHNNR